MKMKFKKITLIVLSLSIFGSLTAQAFYTSTDIFAPMRDAAVKGDYETVYKYASIDTSNEIEETKNVKINVDEYDTHTLYKEMLGIQCEFGDENLTFYDGSELKPSWVNVASASEPKPVYRFGGSSSFYTNMLYNVGPEKDRKSAGTANLFGMQYNGSAAFRMGPVEWIKAVYANNPKAEIIPCLSPVFMKPEEVRDFAHFIYDGAEESSWGKMRAAMGLVEPVSIYYWELGNEIDLYSDEGRSWYINMAKGFAEAILSVNPEAKIAVCGPTAPWGRYWSPDPGQEWFRWHQGIMKELAPIADAITFHPYYDGYSSEFMFWFMDYMKRDIDSYVEELDLRDDKGNLKDIKILSTESARFCGLEANVKYIGTCYQSAISYSNFLNNCFGHEYIVGSMYHNIYASDWLGVFERVSSTDSFYKTPISMLNDLYCKYLGDRVAKSEIEYDGDMIDTINNSGSIFEGNAYSFSATATPNGKDEMLIFLTNKEAHQDINVEFTFKNDYTLTEEILFRAPNTWTFSVDAATEALTKTTATKKNEEHFKSVYVPTECVKVLRLKTKANLLSQSSGTGGGDDILLDGGNKLAEGESGFSDISDAWAYNEIKFMEEQGLISGDGNGMFMPNSNMKKSELVCVLSKLLGLDTDFVGLPFDDVEADSWYLPYANSLFCDGTITDKSLKPESDVTVGELCQIVANAYRLHRSVKKEITSIQAENIPSQYREDAMELINAGILNRLYENGKLDYAEPVSRQGAISVLYRLYKLI